MAFVKEDFYQKLLEILEKYISDPNFNVTSLSQVLHMSQPSLYRKVYALTGKNPTLFLRWYRLNRAAQLLETCSGTVFEVAKMVGFVDHSYFCKCFKEQFQCLPSEIRARCPHISLPEMDLEFRNEVDMIIQEHVFDPEFNVADFAAKLYMDRSTLYRKIMAIYGETPTDFIRFCRLKRAAQLLENNYGNVTQVAFEVGFISSSYFATCFSKMFHQLPTQYRVNTKGQGECGSAG